MSVREAAEASRSHQHADQDETDDRTDLESCECWNDDPGSAEDDKRIAEAGRGELASHEETLPFSGEGR
jgi:hypothetical protein